MNNIVLGILIGWGLIALIYSVHLGVNYFKNELIYKFRKPKRLRKKSHKLS